MLSASAFHPLSLSPLVRIEGVRLLRGQPWEHSPQIRFFGAMPQDQCGARVDRDFPQETI